MPRDVKWTADDIETLKTQWPTDLGAERIGAGMSPPRSGHAVSVKANELGLGRSGYNQGLWTDDDVKALTHLWASDASMEELLKGLSTPRTEEAVKRKAYKLGLGERPVYAHRLNLWQKDAEDLLREKWPTGLTPEEIGALLTPKRTARAVMRKAAEMGLGRSPVRSGTWSADDDALLKKLWGVEEPNVIAKALTEQGRDRTVNAVIGRAWKLGLPQRSGKGVRVDWTDADREELRKLWTPELSAVEIGKKLTTKRTAKAVLAQAQQIGLPPKPRAKSGPRNVTPKPPKPPRRKGSFQINQKPDRQRSLEALRAAPDANGHMGGVSPELLLRRDPAANIALNLTGKVIPLTALRSRTCKWPIGDPRSEGFGFCGSRCRDVYCVEHARIAYEPPMERSGAARPLKVYSRSRR